MAYNAANKLHRNQFIIITDFIISRSSIFVVTHIGEVLQQKLLQNFLHYYKHSKVNVLMTELIRKSLL